MTLSELRHLADQGDTDAQLEYAVRLQAAAYEAECLAMAAPAAAAARTQLDINTNTNAIPPLTPAQRHILSLRHLHFAERLDLLQKHADKLRVRTAPATPAHTKPPLDSRHAEAIRYLHRAADAGNADAMRHLAKTYQNAIGLLSPDEAQADHWIRRAADLGHPIALCDLGLGAVHDNRRDEAFRHLQAAAAHNCARAHYWLYYLHLSPAQDVPIDPFYTPAPENERLALVHLEALAELLDDEDADTHYELAGIYNSLADYHPADSDTHRRYIERHLHHLNIAARCGHDDALIDLCVHHYQAKPPDPALAERHLARAIAQNSPRAHAIRGELFREGKHVPADHRRAVRHYHDALEADPDYPEAHYLLAHMLADGLGIRKNVKAAVHHYQIAADQDYADAHLSLSFLYRDGNGVPQDNKKVLAHLRAAAELECPEAHYALGLCHDEGVIIRRDRDRALTYMRDAAILDSAPAHLWLAIHYYEKPGKIKRAYRYLADRKPTPDDLLAVRHLRVAAEAGDDQARCLLGSFYDSAMIVARDLEQAAHWLRLAAAQGNEEAQKKLPEIERTLAASRPALPPPIPPPLPTPPPPFHSSSCQTTRGLVDSLHTSPQGLIQLQQAAAQNDPAAQLALARLFLEGAPAIGGMKNPIAGFSWLLVSGNKAEISKWETHLTPDEKNHARAIAAQIQASLPPRT